MSQVGQGLFLGETPIQLIQNNNFVSANPFTEPQWQVRNDAFASLVVLAMPGTFVPELGMTNYYDDISSVIRGTGSNKSIIPSGSGANARLWASSSIVNSGSYDFSVDGYETSVFSSGSQNVGFLPSGELDFGSLPFVIEYWINYGPTGFTQPPFNKGISAPGNSPNFFDFAGWAPRYRLGMNDGFTFFNQSQTAGVWYHIAWVRTNVLPNATFNLYINGVRHATSATQTFAFSLNATSYHLMGINSGNTNDGGPSRFNDLRITIGSNRGYTGSTITVPQSIIFKG
jgi:hypothetical protein